MFIFFQIKKSYIMFCNFNFGHICDANPDFASVVSSKSMPQWIWTSFSSACHIVSRVFLPLPGGSIAHLAQLRRRRVCCLGHVFAQQQRRADKNAEAILHLQFTYIHTRYAMHSRFFFVHCERAEKKPGLVFSLSFIRLRAAASFA